MGSPRAKGTPRKFIRRYRKTPRSPKVNKRYYAEEEPPSPNEVIQISGQDVRDFAKAVDGAIEASIKPGGSFDIERFANQVSAEAIRIAATRMKSMTSAEHRISYDATSIEYIEWMMALLLMARSAEILRRKVRNGHCHAHDVPCEGSAGFNERTYHACLESFESMLLELKGKYLQDPD